MYCSCYCASVLILRTIGGMIILKADLIGVSCYKILWGRIPVRYRWFTFQPRIERSPEEGFGRVGLLGLKGDGGR